MSEHCLGAMMFGAVGNPDRDESVRLIHTALDLGITFVDTADMYPTGESEASRRRCCRSASATAWAC